MIQYILHIFQLSSIYEINLLQQCVPSKPWKQPDLSWSIFPILRFYFKFKEWAFHRYALLISGSTTRSMKFLYLIKFMTLHGKCCSLYRRVYEVKSLLSPNILSAGTLAFVYVSSWVLCQCFRSVTLRKWTSRGHKHTHKVRFFKGGSSWWLKISTLFSEWRVNLIDTNDSECIFSVHLQTIILAALRTS